MIYCITEDQSDSLILSAYFELALEHVPRKMIVSNGVPSIPAIARTILSFAEESDRVIVICDQDSFENEKYQKDMLGFLLRGAMNNPLFRLFVFDPNMGILIPEEKKIKGWNSKAKYIQTVVSECSSCIAQNQTIMEILSFINEAIAGDCASTENQV